SNRLRTIGLRLLSNCNGRSNSAVRNTAVPRQKNLNRLPRNLRPQRMVRPCGLWGWAQGYKASAGGGNTPARVRAVAGKKLVDRLSTKAAVAGGKSVTCSAEPPPTSWPL